MASSVTVGSNESSRKAPSLSDASKEPIREPMQEKALQTPPQTTAGAYDPQFEVSFIGDEDPDSPRSKSTARKWLIMFIVSTTSLCVACMSSLFSATYAQIEVEFSTSKIIATLGLSLFVFGLGLSPMILAPLSEVRVQHAVSMVSINGALDGADLGLVLRTSASIPYLHVLFHRMGVTLCCCAKHPDTHHRTFLRWVCWCSLPECCWWYSGGSIPQVQATSTYDGIYERSLVSHDTQGTC